MRVIYASSGKKIMAFVEFGRQRERRSVDVAARASQQRLSNLAERMKDRLDPIRPGMYAEHALSEHDIKTFEGAYMMGSGNEVTKTFVEEIAHVKSSASESETLLRFTGQTEISGVEVGFRVDTAERQGQIVVARHQLLVDKDIPAAQSALKRASYIVDESFPIFDSLLKQPLNNALDDAGANARVERFNFSDLEDEVVVVKLRKRREV